MLMAEALVYLAWARILKAIPFSKVAPMLGVRMAETETAADPDRQAVIRDISRAIRLMSRYTLWESKCLVMAIAGLKMLERRGIESTLYLGTARDDTGNMVAHAWLRSGSCYVTGAEVMRRFTVVATFGNVIPAGERRRSENNG